MAARLAFVVLAVFLIAAAYLLIARPVGTWMEKRTESAQLEAQLEQVEASNQLLLERREALFTAEEIERIARADYNLVRADEEAYAVLPPPARDATWYHAWPY